MYVLNVENEMMQNKALAHVAMVTIAFSYIEPILLDFTLKKILNQDICPYYLQTSTSMVNLILLPTTFEIKVLNLLVMMNVIPASVAVTTFTSWFRMQTFKMLITHMNIEGSPASACSDPCSFTQITKGDIESYIG